MTSKQTTSQVTLSQVKNFHIVQAIAGLNKPSTLLFETLAFVFDF
jgi:hypothetical protein